MSRSFQITLFSFFTLLIPPALISGPFIPDLILSVVSIWFLYMCFKSNELRKFILNTNLTKIFLFFFLLLILSSLFSDEKFYSLKNSLFLFRFFVFAFALAYLLSKNTKLLDNFFKVFLLIFLVLIFDSICQYYFNYNLLGMEKKNWARLSGLFGDEYILGSYLSKFFLLFFGLYKLTQNNKLNFLFFLILAISFFVVFISGDRSALVVMILNLLIIFFFLDLKKYYKILVILFMLSLCIFVFFENNKFKQRMYGTLSKIMITKNLSIGDKSHNNLQKIGIDIFLDNKLLGVGPKIYRFSCLKYSYKFDNFKCENHPHNFYIQILAEAGIFAFCIFVFLYLTLIRHGIHYLRFISLTDKIKDNENLFMFLIVLNLLINFNFILPTGSIFNNWLLISITFPVGFLLFFNLKNKLN